MLQWDRNNSNNIEKPAKPYWSIAVHMFILVYLTEDVSVIICHNQKIVRTFRHWATAAFLNNEDVPFLNNEVIAKKKKKKEAFVAKMSVILHIPMLNN